MRADSYEVAARKLCDMFGPEGELYPRGEYPTTWYTVRYRHWEMLIVCRKGGDNQKGWLCAPNMYTTLCNENSMGTRNQIAVMVEGNSIFKYAVSMSYFLAHKTMKKVDGRGPQPFIYEDKLKKYPIRNMYEEWGIRQVPSNEELANAYHSVFSKLSKSHQLCVSDRVITKMIKKLPREYGDITPDEFRLLLSNIPSLKDYK